MTGTDEVRPGADPRPRARSRRRAVPNVLSVALVTGLVGSGLVVLQGTNAAFTAQTGTSGDTWAAGTLALADDDAGVALFTAGPLVPGDTGTRCVTVTYTGSLATTVKVYVTGASGALTSDLQLTVQQGTGGSYADCTGFSTEATLFTGTLAGFASQSTAYSDGVGTWSPSGPGTSRTYRFTWTLDAATANGRQGASAQASFVWESRA